MRLFGDLEQARFISRPNRFIVLCTIGGRTIRAYLPNPGRLQELLLPGVRLYLEGSGDGKRSTDRTVVAVERRGAPVLLHTHRTNDIACYLIERGLVPGLEGARILKKEVTEGRSRFDFLLQKGKYKVLVEVKSCTLFSQSVAMFPDAVTERGRRHVEELVEISGSYKGTKGQVIFIVSNPGVRYFMPDFHTDPEFARALIAARKKIKITPISIRLKCDLTLSDRVRPLHIPWHVVEREAKDRGAYILVLELPEDRTLEVGALGSIRFGKGYYVYVGSALRGLSARIARHRRRGKKLFWHIDYLREAATLLYSFPVRTSEDIECILAGRFSRLAKGCVPGFGSSDCGCRSHLFIFEEDPLRSEGFFRVLEQFRMERLVKGLNSRQGLYGNIMTPVAPLLQVVLL